MGQHLGRIKTQNALRKHLESKGIDPESCTSFQLVAYGPLHPEVRAEGLDRKALMALHQPFRDKVGALEKALADALREAGYQVLNTVNCNRPLDGPAWAEVSGAFAAFFPKLRQPGALALVQ
jgi:hypothetical protein